MAAVSQKVLNWLYSVLTGSYVDINRTYNDAARVLSAYSALAPRTEVYTYENGSSALLLQISGSLPVVYRGSNYGFPITLWIPHNYPREVPLVYITPNLDMTLRPSQYVSSEGRVYHPYLAGWTDFWDKSTILDLLAILRDIFAKEPPVKANITQRSQPYLESTRPPPIPPLPQGLDQQSSRDMNDRAVSVSASQRPQAPPPPPPKPFGSSIHMGGVSSSPLVSSQPLQHSYNVPQPDPVHSDARLRNFGHGRTGSQPTFKTSNFPTQQAVMHSPVNTSQSFVTTAASRDPHRQYYRSAEPGFQIWNQVVGSNTQNAQVLSKWAAPVASARESYQSTQNVYAPSHSALQNIPNLLDTPAELTIPQPSNLPAPPVPLNPEKDTLLSALGSRLFQERRNASKQAETSLASLAAQHGAMLNASARLQAETDALRSLKSTLTSNESILKESMRTAEHVMKNAKTSEVPQIDEVLVAPNVVSNQLYDLVAEEQALSDSIFFLAQAMEKGRVGIDVFLKNTRSLAREQFLKKALIAKLANGMGLEQEMW
ncbi:MAG: hypothetical protein M1814_003829 [Vezdaea aestivalis]|nr:MAG: hypothetical protein M1814_003829 [Vezdaea aestivalis]